MVEIRARLPAGPTGATHALLRGDAGSWARARASGRGAQIWLRAPLAPADTDVLARFARDTAAWQALPKVGETRRSSVARLRLSAGPVVVKRYSDPGAFLVLTFAKRSRAEREARALDLVGAVLPDNAVRELAWIEERRFGFVARSWLVTEELEQSFDLRRIKRLGAAE